MDYWSCAQTKSYATPTSLDAAVLAQTAVAVGVDWLLAQAAEAEADKEYLRAARYCWVATHLALEVRVHMFICSVMYAPCVVDRTFGPLAFFQGRLSTEQVADIHYQNVDIVAQVQEEDHDEESRRFQDVLIMEALSFDFGSKRYQELLKRQRELPAASGVAEATWESKFGERQCPKQALFSPAGILSKKKNGLIKY